MMVEHLDTRHPRARKPHRCDLCGRTIRVGEEYTASANVDDGRAYTWRECAHCYVLAALLWWLDVDNYMDEGMDREDVAEWEPTDPEHVRLRELWAVRWADEDGDGLVPVPRIIWCRVFHPWKPGAEPRWFQSAVEYGADVSMHQRGSWSRQALRILFDGAS